MNKILHIILFIVLNLLFSVRLWSVDPYTSSLDVRNISPTQVSLSWKSNIKKGSFTIFRSKKGISKPIDLEIATNIWAKKVKGTNAGSLFIFPVVFDSPDQSGDYYYAVLPTSKKYKQTQFKPNINLTLWPTTITLAGPETNLPATNIIALETNDTSNNTILIVPEKKLTNIVTIKQTNQNVTNLVTVVIKAQKSPVTTNKAVIIITNVRVIKKTNKTVVAKIEETEKIIPLEIRNLQIRRKSNSFFLIWKLNRNAEENVKFLVYRNDQAIYQIKGLKPYKIIDNEFFYEDYELELGRNYYYAVILASNPVIKRNKNMNNNPVSFGNKEVNIKVEQEVYYEKIKLSDLKTNVIVKQKKKVPQEMDRNINLKKVVIEDETVKKNENKKREGLNEDTWEDLQGEEKPSYLLLNKGLSGKKKKPEKNKEIKTIVEPEIISEKKKEAPYEFVTNKIVVTNYIDILKPVYVKETNTIFEPENEAEKVIEQPETEKDTNRIEYINEQEEMIKTPDKQYIKVSEKFIYNKRLKTQIVTHKKTLDLQVFNKGLAYYNNKQYKKVIKTLFKDSRWESTLLLGKSYYFLGNYKQALKSFKALRPVKPQTADLWIKMTMNRWGENQ